MVARNVKSSISTVFEGREATTGNASAVRRLSTASVHQDPIKKVEAADVPTVQRFFGLVKYLSKFQQHLSEMCQLYAS